MRRTLSLYSLTPKIRKLMLRMRKKKNLRQILVEGRSTKYLANTSQTVEENVENDPAR